jgi:hypothetical protein
LDGRRVEASPHLQALLVVLAGEVVSAENVENVAEVVQAVRDIWMVAGNSRVRISSASSCSSRARWVAKFIEIDRQVHQTVSDLRMIPLVSLLRIANACSRRSAASA